MLAFAESAWTNSEAKDYKTLLDNIKFLSQLLKESGVMLVPEKEWDILGFKGAWKTVNHFRKLMKPELLKVFYKMNKQNKLRFNPDKA
jgi:hypothetical protein